MGEITTYSWGKVGHGWATVDWLKDSAPHLNQRTWSYSDVGSDKYKARL